MSEYLDKTGLAYLWSKIKAKISSTKAETINAVYPVGSIYMSTESTNPASLFGGTWKSIEEKFLFGASGDYEAGSSGGEINHTLTFDEVIQQAMWCSNEEGNPTIKTEINQGSAYGAYTMNTKATLPHNNMPPYLVVYMWVRTA